MECAGEKPALQLMEDHIFNKLSTVCNYSLQTGETPLLINAPAELIADSNTETLNKCKELSERLVKIGFDVNLFPVTVNNNQIELCIVSTTQLERLVANMETDETLVALYESKLEEN